MPISINGSGTITGINVGGLPTGIVNTATLAANSVNSSILTTDAIYLTAPAGAVAFVAQNSAPTGWLKCNGAAVSRTTYAALFAALGTTFGSGDGSTTFNVPDMRGYFPRGWDDSAGVDSGRVFGSTQADAFKTHSHNITGFTGAINGAAGSHFYNTNQFNTTGATSTTSTPAGSTETRPVNIALLACIKF